MRTIVISDLHLGSASGSDLLRDAQLRAPLLELARGADRAVLLGDALELRHGPARRALAAARPFLAELGSALAGGAGGELFIVAGNHDHALIEPWLAFRAEREQPGELALQQLIEPAQASPMLARMAEWAAPARVLAAYPGVWIRADIYATHGHYLDCHLTVPTLERLSVAAMCRLLGRPPGTFMRTEDYEAVTAPVYAWRDAVAREYAAGPALNGSSTLRAWRALGGAGERRGPAPSRSSAHGAGPGARLARRLRTRALVAAFPLAVAALNRAGFGPLRAEISGSELRRAGLRAMGEVAARLGLSDSHVIFGHTHRAGPLPGDEREEWRGSAGARLLNAGCWTYESIFLTATPGESPYWPGSCVVVDDAGPPQLHRLLAERSHDQLRAARRALRAVV